MKEISYIHAESYAAGELKHGTIALIEEGTPVIAVCCNEALVDKTISNIVEVKARGARVLAVALRGNHKIVSQANDVIFIPNINTLFSPILAVFEMLIKCTMDLSGWSRKKSSAVNCLVLGAISVPCLLGFGTIRGAFLDLFGGTVLDFEDFLVSNVALPLGALFYVLFCVSKRGWGWESFAAEATCGEGGKLPAWAAPIAKLVRPYCTWVLPALLLAIFAIGLYDKFFA